MNVRVVTAAEARAQLDRSLSAGLVDAESACTLLLTRGDGAFGVLQLEMLAFDSELLGAPVARMTVLDAPDLAGFNALLDASRAECVRRGVRHVVRRLPVGAFVETWGLSRAGYQLVDVSVLFERDSDAPSARDASIRLVGAGEAEPLAARFAEAFTLTRFAVDPFFSKEAAAELHRRWILNSCAGRADAVLVADAGGVLAGFVTCRVDHGSKTGNIELIAVDAAQRGAGTGRKLVAAALDWFRGRTERVQVRTQLNNLIATRLYQASGFQLKLGELTYTWVLEEEKVVR